MLPAKLHPEAEQELNGSLHWYERQTPGLGFELLDEVEPAVAAICQHPRTWPLVSESERRYLLHRFPYAVIYEITEEGVHILALMHLHRKPGYWRGRRTP